MSSNELSWKKRQREQGWKTSTEQRRRLDSDEYCFCWICYCEEQQWIWQRWCRRRMSRKEWSRGAWYDRVGSFFCDTKAAKSIAAPRNNKSSKNSIHRYQVCVSAPYSSSNPARAASFSRKARCCSSFPTVFSDMDGSPSSSLLPLQRCKILHLVRHAQGIHNVEGEKNHNAYLSPELFDAHLTPLGWDQVDNLRRHVIACGLSKKIDLVITSPLLRTMQTAVGVFGGEAFVDGVKGKPLMVENAGNSGRRAISSLDGLPFIAVEACREHLGVHPCDRRRTIREYQTLFPAVDFSLIESNEDTLWEPNVREPNEEVAIRGMKFINWLLTRRETEIAVITHSGFLFHTLNKFGKDFHPLIKDEICKHFGNCELRSMVIVDKSLLGFGSDRTNFPGSIPRGLDLPSDIAHDKHPNATSDH